MSELQPGMLAMVIGCNSNPANIGIIVELVKLVQTDETFNGMTFGGSKPCWMIEAKGLKSLFMDGTIVDNNYSFALPSHLLPIKPEADPLDVTHKEELHA